MQTFNEFLENKNQLQEQGWLERPLKRAGKWVMDKIEGTPTGRPTTMRPGEKLPHGLPGGEYGSEFAERYKPGGQFAQKAPPTQRQIFQQDANVLRNVYDAIKTIENAYEANLQTNQAKEFLSGLQNLLPRANFNQIKKALKQTTDSMHQQIAASGT